MSKWLLLFLWLPVFSFAQNKKYPYRAQTISDEVPVYKNADFDAPVIATLPGGKVFEVSSKKTNQAFYRLRVKPGVLGYVSEVDLKLLFTPPGKNKSPEKQAQNPEEMARKQKKKRPFQFTQFAGFQYASLQYREDTMGATREESLGFFGAKISGPNLIIEGESPTEMNFLFFMGAPSYYEKLTGRAADGFVLIMDFLFQNYYPHGRDTLTFFGFGPMMKYSKFNLAVLDSGTGRTSDYSAEDINLGAVFNAGAAVRFNRIALRGELQYYWEKMSYYGWSLGAQFAF